MDAPWPDIARLAFLLALPLLVGWAGRRFGNGDRSGSAAADSEKGSSRSRS